MSASLYFYKERGFGFEPFSVEDAQRLWELDKQHMEETLQRQKQEMLADSQWLEKKEKLLVSKKLLKSNIEKYYSGGNKYSTC